MNDFIALELIGLKELQTKINRLPDAAADEGVEEASLYMVNVLRQYPPQKRVTIAQAGGWKSDKQRRWFFAALRRGEIQVPYHRTQQLADGWKILGYGKSSFIANETSYAKYVMGDGDQSRMHELIGWQKLQAFLTARAQQIIRKFDAGVKNAIHRLGL